MPTASLQPRTLKDALALLAVFEAQATSVAWRLGMVLIAIHDFKLWTETASTATSSTGWRTPGRSRCNTPGSSCTSRACSPTRKTAAAIGVTRGYELILYCDETGEDPKALVERNAVIAGRPISKHTRRSLVDATREVRLNSVPRDPFPPEPAVYDDPYEYVPPVVTTPPERLREGERAARQLVRWLEEEGATGIEAAVRSWNGQPWINVRVPLGQVPMLLD